MTAGGVDPWRVLGLRPGADPATISAAWRALAARHHPDAGGDPERFRQLVAARDQLRRRRRSTLRHPVAAVEVRRSTATDRLLRPIRRRIARRLDPRVR